MQAEVILPELGVSPVFLSVWFADPGDFVYEGDRLVEVLVEGATFDVSAPATGKLATRIVMPDERIVAGQVLGTVETEEEVTQ